MQQEYETHSRRDFATTNVFPCSVSSLPHTMHRKNSVTLEMRQRIKLQNLLQRARLSWS
jgi:hypothetical protein